MKVLNLLVIKIILFSYSKIIFISNLYENYLN